MTKIKIKTEDDQPETSGVATTVGVILVTCVCALIISATVAVVKWILGV